MKRLAAMILLFMPVLLLAQEGGADGNTMWGALLGALGLVAIQFLGGLALKSKAWAEAWMDVRIARLKQKRKEV